MDAIKFILMEHRKIRKMVANISKNKSSAARQKKQFLPFSIYLIRHETMEEKKWYPFLRKNTKLASVIKHLIKEEKTAAKAIKKIKKIKPEKKWQEKFAALKKAVEHHAREEETKLFPKVRKKVAAIELKQIGKKLQRFRKALDRR